MKKKFLVVERTRQEVSDNIYYVKVENLRSFSMGSF